MLGRSASLVHRCPALIALAPSTSTADGGAVRSLYTNSKRVVREDGKVRYENFLKDAKEGGGGDDNAAPMSLFSNSLVDEVSASMHSFTSVSSAVLPPSPGAGAKWTGANAVESRLPSLHQLREEIPASAEVKKIIAAGEGDELLKWAAPVEGDDDE